MWYTWIVVYNHMHITMARITHHTSYTVYRSYRHICRCTSMCTYIYIPLGVELHHRHFKIDNPYSALGSSKLISEVLQDGSFFCHEPVEPCSSLIFVAFSELSAVVPYFLPVLFRPSLYAYPGSWWSPNTFANHVIQCRIEHSRPFVGHPKPGSMLSVKKFYRRWTDGNKKSAQMTSKQQSLHVFGTRRRIQIHRIW